MDYELRIILAPQERETGNEQNTQVSGEVLRKGSPFKDFILSYSFYKNNIQINFETTWQPPCAIIEYLKPYFLYR